MNAYSLILAKTETTTPILSPPPHYSLRRPVTVISGHPPAITTNLSLKTTLRLPH